MKEKGFILWKGASKEGSADIVVIATMKTTNRKTGDMVQIWILLDHIDPVKASRMALDGAICGECPHRWSKKGDCYVNLGQAPLSIWKAYKRGSYRDIRGEKEIGKHFFGRAVRFGAYGDPFYIPLEIVQNIVKYASKHTGYTHQWKSKGASAYSFYLMASVDNEKESVEASSRGWRYFRVRYGNEALEGEIECPSVTRGIQCANCTLCDGFKEGVKSIRITAHGSRSNKLLKA